MKLASFQYGSRTAWGAVRGEQVFDLSHAWPDLRSALGAGVGAIAAALDDGGRAVESGDIKWLPPIPEPRKILCVGLNYRRHILEAGRELPRQPSLFVRFSDSFVGHNEPIRRPACSDKFDFEGELAFVIGRGGRHIKARDAWNHVAAYTCMAENSVRDFQKHSAQVTPGKNFDRSGSIGPFLVTSDEIPDPSVLNVITRLNGVQMQNGEVSDLIFPIPVLIEYISTFTTLHPGDIIATGTPDGVGSARTPPVFMKAGDVLEVEIPAVGLLVNTVADEAGPH